MSKNRITNAEIRDLIENQNDERTEFKTEISKLREEFNKFTKEYDYDMRGDNEVNGYRGLVNEVIDIKKHLKEYPTLIEIIKKNPIKSLGTLVSTIAGGIAFWLVMHVIVSIPGVEIWITNVFGIPLP